LIVFCNTKTKCLGVSEFLSNHKFDAKILSSDLKQTERINRLNLFKVGKIFALVASDVAARGLQISNVDLVINYDVPPRSELYVHRIGRTGRQDKKGSAVTFICPEDIERFEIIEEEFKLDVKELNL